MKYFMCILILIAVSYPTLTFGQPSIAIRGGANLTTFGGDVTHVHGSRRSLKIGTSVAISIRDQFQLQIGGDYVSKGAKLYFLDESEIKIDYVEFSGLANIALISPRRAPSLSILIGPTVAFKVRSEGEDQIATRYWIDRFMFKTLDFGITGGIGTEIGIFKIMVFRTELLYTRSIRSTNVTVIYDPNYSEEEPTNMTNRTISLCIGLGFPYRRKTGG